MALKKTAPKKTVKKSKVIDLSKVKPIRAIEKTKGNIIIPTEIESKVIDKLTLLQKDGYSVTLRCEGRQKQVKAGECILAYIRANKPIELVGMQSGTAAKTVPL